MIADLIEKAGGSEAVSSGCKVSTDALRKWREAGAVPAKHWPWFAATLGWSLDRVMKAAVEREAALGIPRHVSRPDLFDKAA